MSAPELIKTTSEVAAALVMGVTNPQPISAVNGRVENLELGDTHSLFLDAGQVSALRDPLDLFNPITEVVVADLSIESHKIIEHYPVGVEAVISAAAEKGLELVAWNDDYQSFEFINEAGEQIFFYPGGETSAEAQTGLENGFVRITGLATTDFSKGESGLRLLVASPLTYEFAGSPGEIVVNDEYYTPDRVDLLFQFFLERESGYITNPQGKTLVLMPLPKDVSNPNFALQNEAQLSADLAGDFASGYLQFDDLVIVPALINPSTVRDDDEYFQALNLESAYLASILTAFEIGTFGYNDYEQGPAFEAYIQIQREYWNWVLDQEIRNPDEDRTLRGELFKFVPRDN